ncbi:MAG TPA: MFS transporter [Trebonia sp.]|nr:MFS transporter [Trebonia sp.]
MTATLGEAPPSGLIGGLWRRQLAHYPNTWPRMFYLSIVVLATIMLYYELYIGGAVSTEIIRGYGMTFPFYVYISVVGNAIGAFGSLAAGLTDRWGRANLVAYGLVITAVLALVVIPNATTKWEFLILSGVIGLVEGVILVATPALVRDFSPQLGRASAMGFWTLGPVVGSLVVAIVSTNTVGHLPPWQDQYIICGVVGLVVAVIALVGLRELSPQLRDQIMVSMRDRALIEAKARGIDIYESLKRPWKQMMHLDIVGSAFAIAVFLLFYYTAVGFFVVYFTTLHGFSLSRANSLGNWFWAFDAGALIIVGVISDRLRVRKPFMVIGAIGAIYSMVVFLNLGPNTSYTTFAVWISLIAIFSAIVYAPWMASFTETVEKRNPALIATGLAVWGWIIRIVIAVSIGILPTVLSSMTPLITYGPQAQVYEAQYPAGFAALQQLDPTTAATLAKDPTNAAAGLKAVGEVQSGLGVTQAAAIADLTAAQKIPAADLAFIQEHVAGPSAAAPGQWRTWWWVCVGGVIVFLPFVLVMAGEWSPKKAREEAEAHERAVEAELAALQAQQAQEQEA